MGEARWQIDIVRDAIAHQFKFTIRWNKRNGSIGIEFTETYTAMKGAIVNFDAWFAIFLFLVNDELVV